MATIEQNYDKLRGFINAFPAYVESKKDLLKVKDKRLLKSYYIYRAYFKINRGYRPSRVLDELRKYKKRNLKFKSEHLGIDLSKVDGFDSYDKYDSSSKLIAVVTDAMLKVDSIKLNSVGYESKDIDIRYKVTVNRKCVVFDTNNDFEFFKYLPDNFRINIWNSTEDGKVNKSSYTKTGLDFLYDYHNQSNDFSTQLAPLIDDKIMFIFKRN